VEPHLDTVVGDLQTGVIRDAREVCGEEIVRRWLEAPHAGVTKDCDAHARATGPCGDTMEVFVTIREGRVADASFVMDGCASSVACGSMACDLAIGKTLAGLREVTQGANLKAFGGLPEADLHCALLAARTLDEAARGWTGRHEVGERGRAGGADMGAPASGSAEQRGPQMVRHGRPSAGRRRNRAHTARLRRNA
jgi:nitrogen fixation NifU-like protein